MSTQLEEAPIALQISVEELLQALDQLPTAQLEAFVAQASLLYVQRSTPTILPYNEQLFEALLSAFPDADGLERMVYFKLKKDLATIIPTGNLSNTIYHLIRWAEANNQAENLIRGANNWRSGNPHRIALAEQLGLSTDEN